MMIPMILLAILTWLALGYIGSRLSLSYLERGTDIPLDKDNYTMATIFMVFGLLNFLVDYPWPVWTVPVETAPQT